MGDTYDLAFSFAGEDRSYVEAVKIECEKLGISVYYDEDRKIDQWGLSFIQKQRAVYSGYRTKYFVPFISEHYFNKAIPTDEFKAALSKSIKEDGYILPVKIDDSNISEQYMHPHTQYLKATDYSPQELAHAFKEKLTKSKKAEEIDEKLSEELALPKIKITPRNYNPYDHAESLLEYISRQFKSNLLVIEAEGYITSVRRNNDEVMIRVQKEGHLIFALNVFYADNGDETSLGYNFDGRSMMANARSQNGYIKPKFNKDAAVPGYEIADMFQSEGLIVSSEEVVKFFWSKLKENVEQHA